VRRARPAKPLSTLQLLISELVTNSVRHAALGSTDRVRLDVRIIPGAIRVEVRDPGPGFEPSAQPPTPYQEAGWGLHIVERLADRWGVLQDRATVVWFELDR
jgi:anti-sigma regulatory factor (Ser/Thr protein kinase)